MNSRCAFVLGVLLPLGGCTDLSEIQGTLVGSWEIRSADLWTCSRFAPDQTFSISLLERNHDDESAELNPDTAKLSIRQGSLWRVETGRRLLLDFEQSESYTENRAEPGTPFPQQQLGRSFIIKSIDGRSMEFTGSRPHLRGKQWFHARKVDSCSAAFNKRANTTETGSGTTETGSGADIDDSANS